MSSPRYCDLQAAPDCPSRPPHHGVFSELEIGWTTMSGTKTVRDERTGKRTSVEVDQDACPRCVAFREGTWKTTVNEQYGKQAIVSGKTRTVDAEEYAAYLAYLEDQAKRPIETDYDSLITTAQVS